MSAILSYAFGYRAPGSPPAYRELDQLALSLAAHAEKLGLQLVHIRASRMPRSATKHIRLRDGAGRDWLIRLSDHQSNGPNGYERNHLDLVSRDGRTGFEVAVGFVSRVARGEEPWTPPERTRLRKGQKLWGRK